VSQPLTEQLRGFRYPQVSTLDGTTFARLEIPDSPGNEIGIRFPPDGERFAVLWRDGRIDLVEPDALRRALLPLGLGW